VCSAQNGCFVYFLDFLLYRFVAQVHLLYGKSERTGSICQTAVSV